MKKQTWISCLTLAAACSLSASSASHANAGFTPLVSPDEVINPQVDDLIEVVVEVANTTEVRQTRLLVRYDPLFFEFVAFAAGDHPAGVFAFPESPVDGGDGLSTVGGGGAILGGSSDTSGGGILGTLTFRLIKELEGEKFLSVSSIRVAKSSSDFDELTFEVG